MARSWQKVRDDVIASGHLDPQAVANARTAADEAARAYKLAEVRRTHGGTQKNVAAMMHVSQARVSKIERGDLSRAELGTLQAYVEALGGRLRVVADFGDQTITIE